MGRRRKRGISPDGRCASQCACAKCAALPWQLAGIQKRHVAQKFMRRTTRPLSRVVSHRVGGESASKGVHPSDTRFGARTTHKRAVAVASRSDASSAVTCRSWSLNVESNSVLVPVFLVLFFSWLQSAVVAALAAVACGAFQTQKQDEDFARSMAASRRASEAVCDALARPHCLFSSASSAW